MDFELQDEEKGLSACETLLMKIIWDADHDVSTNELMEALKVRFNKDYSRTTVATFLLRLTGKGFVRTYRNGRNSYARAMKSEDEYRQKVLEEQTNFWYGGKPSNMIAALCSADAISEEEARRIREILDGMDI